MTARVLRNGFRLGLLSSTLLSLPAHAQSTDATTTISSNEMAGQTEARGLEEILVTARKRTETLINVPVAVSAVSGQEIQRTGVADLTRIAQLVPQVILAQADSGTGASFSIRGLGTSFLDPGLDQSVLVVLDGAPVSRGQVILMGTFDLAQVEVLKGPQALYFGKNSPAGVVSLTSAAATDTISGYARIGYEFQAREKFVEAAISGPLTTTLKGRFAVRGTDMRGWMKNVAAGVPAPVIPGVGPLSPPFFPVSADPIHRYGPGNREIMARGTLTWTPSSRFNATLKSAIGDHKDNGTTTQQYCDPAVHSGPVSIGGFEDPNADCKFDNRFSSTGVPPQYIQDTWRGVRKDGGTFARVKTFLTTLNMNYNFDHIALTSQTNFMKLKFGQAKNFDETSYGLVNSWIGENTRSFSQELRATTSFGGPINLTVGAYYEKLRRTNLNETIILFVGPVPAGSPGAGRYDNLFNPNRAKAETISGFGQVRWEIVPKLELAGGVRYTKETRDQEVENLFIHPFVLGPTALGDLVPVGVKLKGRFRDTNWSPEVTLSYKPQRDMLLYAAFKTDYKSGGFPSLSLFKRNPDGSVPTGEQFAFGPESAKGFEVGFKAELFNRTLRIEATAYNYKYSDLQQSIFDPPTFSFLIRNAASARIRGIELGTTWIAMPELRLTANAAYNKATYISYPNSGCYTAQTAEEGCLPNSQGTLVQDLSGRTLPRAPRWNLQAGFAYDTTINDGLMVGLSGDVNYTSKYATQETQPPFAVQRSFALFNAGVRLYTEDNHYELALIGRNLANKYYVQLSTSAAFAQTQDNLAAATARPREVRLQATYRF